MVGQVGGGKIDQSEAWSGAAGLVAMADEICWIWPFGLAGWEYPARTTHGVWLRV